MSGVNQRARVADVVDLGRSGYEAVFADMRAYTDGRDEDTPDQIWLTEHERVFTQGQAGKPEHLLMPGDIPVVQSDRGGQVTYHGPGQIVGYLLFDIRRLGLSVRDLVSGIEQSMIRVLGGYGIAAAARPDAPGVYVAGAKIGSLGLRVRRGCSYHGLALNVNMDLEPFSRINPCGLTDTTVTQIVDLGGPGDLDRVRSDLLDALAAVFRLSLRTPDSPAPSAT
ncbi:MAG: lipoyl(octanoyl) transferase LipB [Pseudomonadales bacterium]|jgi:lipoyl(octanoyl) transferase